MSRFWALMTSHEDRHLGRKGCAPLRGCGEYSATRSGAAGIAYVSCRGPAYMFCLSRAHSFGLVRIVPDEPLSDGSLILRGAS